MVRPRGEDVPDVDTHNVQVRLDVPSSLPREERLPLSVEDPAGVVPVDESWLSGIASVIRDGLIVVDSTGLILQMNRAFTEIVGYGLDEGPYRPPYPWWPTPEEDAESLAVILRTFETVLRDGDSQGEFFLYRPDRSRVLVHSSGASVKHDAIGEYHLLTAHDVSRKRDAERRRAQAAKISESFVTVDDVQALITFATFGFGLLFDGDCTLQIADGDYRHCFDSSGVTDPSQLMDEVRTGLGGTTSADTFSLRSGVLLLPPTSDEHCRAWVQFPHPRRITVDEMIVADLLAAAFAAALRRFFDAEQAQTKVANLQRAVESHRIVGQATGILVERHHIQAASAFERLRKASRDRNLKLRDLAERVIESGLDPEEA